MEDHSLVHPLAETLASVNETNEYLKAQYGVPEGDSWHRSHEAFTSGSATLKKRISKTEAELHTTAPTIVANSLLQGYQWPLIHAAVSCYVLDRRVPEVQPEDVWLHTKLDGEHEDEIDAVALAGGRFWALPDDPHAAHPDATVVPDQAALRDALRDMITAHFAPTIELLCAELGCKPRGLWLVVADGLAGTATWVRTEHDKTLTMAQGDAELDGLVRVLGSPLFSKQIGLFELTYRDDTQLHYDRATCCYWFKTEDAKGDFCTTCPKRPTEERNALLLKYMVTEYAERTNDEALNARIQELDA